MITSLFFLSFALVGLLAEEVALTPSLEGSNHVEMEDLGNGEWEIRSTGHDPYFYLYSDGRKIDLEQQSTFSFEYFSTTGIGRILVFVGPVLSVPHMVTVTGVGKREGWSPYGIDLTATLEEPTEAVKSLRVTIGEGPGVVARFRGFRARSATVEEKRLVEKRAEKLVQDEELETRLKRYLEQEFSQYIDIVLADEEKITIRGKVSDSGKGMQLAEIPMWEDVTELKEPASLHELVADDEGCFEVVVERGLATDREMLLSGWAVVREDEDGFELLSAMRYVEEQKSRANLPAARPRSLKGLGGGPFDHPDLKELGVASVTLNIVLNDLFANEPGPGRTPYEFAGMSWQLNDAVVAHYDRQMKMAAEHEWMVSAIILLQPVREAPEGAWIRDAAHPDADGTGLYVMPNFTSRRGVNAYAAAMNFLAERYNRPDKRYGRVHYWIMHNEINSGFYWTNAGRKTALTYLDLYQKSMRVICLLARQYDPHAKPLISLDHHWAQRSDVRAYTARELLDYLVSYSRKEGDFPWGIAFHPYAQDLRNPRTWEDTAVSFDFSTPMITYKNIEVLDAWARQEQVAYQGESREVQLTEQGLNSPDYSEKSFTDQAAGLAYAWKKVEGLPSITAFQYHQWADHPAEGGLRLGLRRFADDPEEPHGIKPIWHVYKAMDTDAWEEASSFAKPILGIQHWGDVRYQGEIGAGTSE